MPRRADRESIRQLTAAGHTTAEIADRLHCSRRTVTRARTALGIARPLPPRWRTQLDEHDVALIEQLLADGWSFSEIERTHGYTWKTLTRRWPGQGMDKAEGNRLGLAVRRANEQLRKLERAS